MSTNKRDSHTNTSVAGYSFVCLLINGIKHTLIAWTNPCHWLFAALWKLSSHLTSDFFQNKSILSHANRMTLKFSFQIYTLEKDIARS